MTKFKELDKRKAYEVEQDILKSWGGINKINEAQIENRKDNKTFVFYDGPAFANGFPGLHHMVSKNLKDIICKYHVMKGEKVVRKVGWDTHGLPIENHVEKKLGISSKKDIEAMGVEKFNEEFSYKENNKKCRIKINKKEQDLCEFYDLNNNEVTLVRRDNLEKQVVKLNDIINVVTQQMELMQSDMYERALKNMKEKTYDASNMDEVKEIMENHPGFVNAYWCGEEACELKMKEIRGTKSRCIVESKDYETEKCVVCNKKAKHRVVWGIQY